jgi:hypothetical protein
MRILAIDPGSEQSAYLLLDDGVPQVGYFAKIPNEELLGAIRGYSFRAMLKASLVVIEWTAPRGMPASAQLFETLWWAGRFAEACQPIPVERLERAHVKRHLCGTSAAKDSNVIAALIDRFGGAGGRAVAVGLKASQGPLYGVHHDVWQALAVAVAYADGAR